VKEINELLDESEKHIGSCTPDALRALHSAVSKLAALVSAKPAKK
jgi:hypothetical protein